MKPPRGKIKLKYLTVCGTGRKIEILMKLPRGKLTLRSLTVCGTVPDILYETFERED